MVSHSEDRKSCLEEQGDHPNLRYQQYHRGTQKPLVGWGFMVGNSLLWNKVPKDGPNHKYDYKKQVQQTQEGHTCEGSRASVSRPFTIISAVHTPLIRDEATLQVHLQGSAPWTQSPTTPCSAKSFPRRQQTVPEAWILQVYREAEAFHRQAKAREAGSQGTIIFEDMGLSILTSLGEVLHIWLRHTKC